MYKIIHKDPGKSILFACGFANEDRARQWVERFNPAHYTDKTFKKEDMLIVREK